MAPRSFWKGYLMLSLVTCPVTMMPATSEAERVRFHTLNARTGNRVVSQLVDAVSGNPVREGDEVRGYATGEDAHVLLEDSDLESIALDSTRTIDIEMFVPADSIGWIWYDTPHYLAPSDRIGAEAFSVIREAMAATGTVGIARLVLYRRERAVMLKPRGRGIVLWTLRYGDEVREPPADFGAEARPEAEPLKLLTRLIADRTRPWDPDMVSDPVQAALLGMIAAKKKRRPARSRPAPSGKPGNVVSILDALQKSLAAEKSGRRGSGRKPRRGDGKPERDG